MSRRREELRAHVADRSERELDAPLLRVQLREELPVFGMKQSRALRQNRSKSCSAPKSPSSTDGGRAMRSPQRSSDDQSARAIQTSAEGKGNLCGHRRCCFAKKLAPLGTKSRLWYRARRFFADPRQEIGGTARAHSAVEHSVTSHSGGFGPACHDSHSRPANAVSAAGGS